MSRWLLRSFWSAGVVVVLLVGALPLAVARAQSAAPYLNFESGAVRPVALSPDRSLLFAVNTPDARLEILEVTAGGLEHRASVQVGLEPVAVAARSDGEVWVVNHLSDSVSIVDVASARVRRTLLVGDEPRDIVFARAGTRAFVTTAHRGQRRADPALAGVPGAGDPRLSDAGVRRADVWVFDPAALGEPAGGTPRAIVELFGDTPRALAVSPDDSTVYAAVFHSGNRTTVVSEAAVCDGFAAAGPCQVGGASIPGGNPGPATNAAGAKAPEVGLIVKFDASLDAWRDERGRDWSPAVRFDLPDYDVFAIDADSLVEAAPPIAGVGTTLFNMAVNPVDGALYVSNTEAKNEIRFEGPGTFGGSTVQGHLAEARITVVPGVVAGATTGGQARPRHLNKHIDYALRPAPAGTAEHSLAIPVDLAVSADGATLYVAAFGSARVGVFPTVALADDSFDPEALSGGYIELSGGGPAGLALDEGRGRLYVLTRFDNAVKVVNLTTGAEEQSVALPDPEPAALVAGRRFLYDARLSSSNGEASCASCHVFGDMDHLAWDLGNPDDGVTKSPMAIRLEIAAGPNINGTGNPEDFHPMKGPMTTQTLRGMAFAGAQHWRGDRATGFFGTSADDARLSFKNFVVAFGGLLGREGQTSEAEMDQFADFALAGVMPPNPVRNLDNSLTAAQAQAMSFFASTTRLSDGVPVAGFGFSCAGCHALDASRGQFGTDGVQSFEAETQILKIPQLRNLYQKVGMFGMVAIPPMNPGNNGHQQEQVRGFGFSHDGSIDTLFRFFQFRVFNPSGGAVGFQGGDAERRAMESLMLAFDTDLAPIVGQQVTLTGAPAAAAPELAARIDLLIARAQAPFVSKLLGGVTRECDLVAKVRVDGRVRGYVFQGGMFLPDDDSAPVSDAGLRAMALAGAGHEVTYTCVPPGTGVRFGVDRDQDGVKDGLEPAPEPRTNRAEAMLGPGGEVGGCGCDAQGSVPPPASGILLMLSVAMVSRRRRARTAARVGRLA